MEPVNIEQSANLISTAPTTNEEKQTPSDAGPATESSPLPPRTSRPRQGSAGRKRTNEEAWQPGETPATSPKTARFKRSLTLLVMPESEVQRAQEHPTPTTGEGAQTQRSVIADREGSASFPPRNSFTKQIHDYQQQLELEYQQFEQSLNERDTAADLDAMNWEDLETRYNDEMTPCIIREKEVMDEINARFAQFMLYLQVSNDHEAERAVKRLRTRIALAQNSEGLLAQKQAHHMKVLEAFHSAMALLGNV
ncbi:hypothetical protein G647_02767 [Cladophialophora carrionii CBS 160.54]|uniref:Uncharacterized protein n=1 Tax=Cladophialophora carrionii CBS 160.54 TaxID=1279043 RepID=V9DGL6_9EURO|nr:uncharacterized protein G647_02767 [Cladophialophora carrionii CBS 160.54]ETI25990.1 hypothetical protein G647_02767 [Cladophialophora carrionii CBS 160.54]